MTEASSDTVQPDTATAVHEGFGSVLKREREAQGISLGDMATLSRLSVDQVRALESEDVEKLPVPVYTRAFIRDVAKQLGIDHAPLVDDYVARFGEADEGQIPPEDPSAEVVISHHHENRGIKISGIGLIVALVAIGGWGVYTELLAPEKNETLKTEAVVTAPADTQTNAVEALPKTVEAEVGVPSALHPTSAKSTQSEPEEVLPAPDVKAEKPVVETEKPEKAVEEIVKPVEAVQKAEAPVKKAEEPAAEVSEPAKPLSDEQHLVMKVNSDVWIHIRSIRGKNLVARTVNAGTTIDMLIPRGSHFTIGKTSAVEMSVDGEPYSFEQKGKRGIAKFILK